MSTISENFLNAVERAIAETGINATEFGRRALGDPNFVFDLRRGRSCQAATMDRVYRFIGELGAAA